MFPRTIGEKIDDMIYNQTAILNTFIALCLKKELFSEHEFKEEINIQSKKLKKVYSKRDSLQSFAERLKEYKGVKDETSD